MTRVNMSSDNDARLNSRMLVKHVMRKVTMTRVLSRIVNDVRTDSMLLLLMLVISD
jgi:hypothetical protein